MTFLIAVLYLSLKNFRIVVIPSVVYLPICVPGSLRILNCMYFVVFQTFFFMFLRAIDLLWK
uniref:Uncharacterized protein n=1 Tax=Anguilla anguilla TaxID=7936 RepID=A0A0E9TE06_ANGAN